MTPLVSILIPAFNAQKWIAETLRSALAQTWWRKEIIVVDDGSEDRTLAAAQALASTELSVVSRPHRGAAAARNDAFALCQGDYVQWLDADDLLAPDKIANQMQVALRGGIARTLYSAAWAYFAYRCRRARFSPTALWCDLAPSEWLLRKMEHNLFMPNATWLVSRDVASAAGPWDTRLSTDDDGEYFARVLLASDGVRFVPDARAYYRLSGPSGLSSIDGADGKRESQWLSMQLHVGYVRSLDDGARARAACVNYLQASLPFFHPDRPDIVEQMQHAAARLGGALAAPALSWQYAWVGRLFGWRAARGVRRRYNSAKRALPRAWDRAMFELERRLAAAGGNADSTSHSDSRPAGR